MARSVCSFVQGLQWSERRSGVCCLGSGFLSEAAGSADISNEVIVAPGFTERGTAGRVSGTGV